MNEFSWVRELLFTSEIQSYASRVTHAAQVSSEMLDKQRYPDPPRLEVECEADPIKTQLFQNSSNQGDDGLKTGRSSIEEECSICCIILAIESTK
jgi:hypothetical protein